MRDHPPGVALAERPPEVPIDMRARVIDQTSIVDARRTGRLATQAGQTAIEVRDGLRVRGTAAFEHPANEIDAAARRIVFVTEQDISRTGLRAEAVAYAAPDHARAAR
jgi:hypothetical protein